jgi:transcriptional regulator of arginine metabolism
MRHDAFLSITAGRDERGGRPSYGRSHHLSDERAGDAAGSGEPVTAPALHNPAARRALILDLIRRHEVKSQEALRLELRRMGVRVTQATLSRDIRDLGLGKVGGRYVLPEPAVLAAAPAPLPNADDVVSRALARNLVSVNSAGAVIVLKTSPGKAHATAVEIDRARWKELLGTVAGDDTIIGIARSPRAARAALQRVRDLLS